MSNAQMFFNMAINESNAPAFNNDAKSIAITAVSGAIGQCSGTDDRDAFVQAGFDYLDRFDETAERAVEELTQSDEPRDDVIAEIRALHARVKQVELAEFFRLLIANFDERE